MYVSVYHIAAQSVLLFVGFFPVVVVGFEHEGVAARKHHITQPHHKHSERQQEPVLPQGASQDRNQDRNKQKPQQALVSVGSVHLLMS